MGQSPPSSTYRDQPEGLPFFQGKADFGLVHPTARKWCVEPRKVARTGDILISVRAPVGPTNIADVECCIGRGLAAVRALPGVDQGFLLHALKVLDPEITARSTGSTFQAISGQNLRSLRVALPHISEQRRIASLMSTVERGRTVAAAQLARIDDLSAALLREIFPRSPAARLPRGWRWVTLGDVVVSTPSVDPQRNPTDPFLYIDISAIDRGAKTVSGTKTLVGAEAPSRARRAVAAGDVIVSTTRPNLNAVALIPPELDGAVCSTGFCVLRAGPSATSSYLYYLVQSQGFVDEMIEKMTGASYPAVTDTGVRSFSFPLPPLGEQHRIGRTFSAVEDARLATVAQLAAIDQLSDTLLKRLFAPPVG